MTKVSALRVESGAWVDLAVSDLPSGTVACRVVRTWLGVEAVLPGAGRFRLLGSEWRFIDYALPASLSGDQVAYRVEPLGSDGRVIASGVASVSVGAVTVGHAEVLISDPLVPLSVARGILRGDGKRSWSTSPSLVAVMGGAPIALGSRATLERSWPISTEAASDAARMRGIVAEASVILIRGDANCLDHPTGVIHLASDGVELSMQRGTHETSRRWVVSGVECAPPAQLAVSAARSYADDLSEQPTYAASLAAFQTYLDRVRGGL